MPSGSPDGDDPAPIVIAPDSTERAVLSSEYGPQPAPWIAEPAAAVDLYRGESVVPPREGVRTAPLLHAMGERLAAAGSEAAAVRCYQEAIVADPLFVTPLGPLRRLLAAQGDWLALVALLDRALQHPALPLGDKADLWVERGRVLEDHLGRNADADASYRAALTAPRSTTGSGTGEVVVDHPPALLALLLLAARTGDAAATETALHGLARLARGSSSEATVSAALARAQRAAADDGEGRALRTIGDALTSPSVGDGEALLQQLEALTRARDPRVRAAALGDLARRTGPGEPPPPALVAALLREQGRLFRGELDDPLAAFASFREALALHPTHPVLAIAMADIADHLNRGDLLEQVFDLCPETVDGAPNPLRRQIVLRQAEVLARQARPADALALLQVHPDLAAADPRVSAVEAVLRARTGDAATLAAAFEGDGERLSGLRAAQAFLRAAALAEWALEQGDRAESLMRKALALAPGYRPAIVALTKKLRAAGRGGELAGVFEAELASLDQMSNKDDDRRRGLLESLVVLCRDELRDPARARTHQRRLVATAPPGPARVRALARLIDLAFLIEAGHSSAGGGGDREMVDELTALGDAVDADDPALAAALRAQAAWALVGTVRVDDDRRRAAALFRQALSADDSDRTAAGLEALLAGPAFPEGQVGQARAEALAAEIAAAEARGAGAVARALRFRLSVACADGGRGDGVLAALQPLRAVGDRLARAFSLDLARAAQRPDWLARLLTEPTPGRSPTMDDSLALAEAIEAQGRWSEAADRYAEAARAAGTPVMDAALGALRCAAAAPAPTVNALVESLAAVAAASADDPALASAARREGQLLAAAAGEGGALAALASSGTAAADAAVEADAADVALGAWMAAVRGNDARAVGDALLALGRASDDRAQIMPALLARAAARARLGGTVDAQRVQMLAWRELPEASALQHGLTDLPALLPPAPSLSGLGAARAARAAAAGGTLGAALDLERAVDAELGGRAGEALDAYGWVLARDPESVEAIEGVRRLAQSAGDALGQARALARLGTLAKGGRAAALFAEGARLYEQAGRVDAALSLYFCVLGERPGDEAATARLTTLLTGALDRPARAADYDRLLGHRLSLLPYEQPARVPLLLERARHRLLHLDREEAVQDFKRILKIVPYHEEALGELAALAIAESSPADAVGLLERYLAVARDPDRAAQARLDLAAAYETLHEPARAVEILGYAAAASVADARPRERLVDLLLRVSDWRGALAALRAWDQATTVPQEKAKLYIRIGTLLRDHALDQSGAAQSFRLAADLDPLGEGARLLVALYESLGDAPGRWRAIAREIADLRQALAARPLDVARLHRLREFLQRDGAGNDAAAPVEQTLALLGEIAEPLAAPPPRRRLGAGLSASAFWDRLALPQAAGFFTEIWLLIADAVAEMHRPDAAALAGLGLSRANRLAPANEPRLHWVEATAAALGIEGLSFYAASPPASSSGPSPSADGDTRVACVELPEPALIFDRAALLGGASARFRFGRALSLLRQRASVLDRLPTDGLRYIFLAAGALAGAPPPTDADAAALAPVVKGLGKALARKDRKTLALQASRFAFEATDVEAWRRAVLGTADRLGLVIAGDVATAARVVAAGPGGVVDAAWLQTSEAAIDLVRFGLDGAYLELRAEAGTAGSEQ